MPHDVHAARKLRENPIFVVTASRIGAREIRARVHSFVPFTCRSELSSLRRLSFLEPKSHYVGMSRRSMEVTAELVLRAYRYGLFPMAEGRQTEKLFWLDPVKRGVLPLDEFHLSRRLLRTVLSSLYQVRVDTDFVGTISGCATPLPTRPDTWINPQIERLFTELHLMGHAHSVETWHNEELVGGLYGVAIGGVFFGESMFSFARDASKVALVHLVARLRLGGFRLLDTQFITSHLQQFGAEEIPREAYRKQLSEALEVQAVWLLDWGQDVIRDEFRRLARRRDQDTIKASARLPL